MVGRRVEPTYFSFPLSALYFIPYVLAFAAETKRRFCAEAVHYGDEVSTSHVFSYLWARDYHEVLGYVSFSDFWGFWRPSDSVWRIGKVEDCSRSLEDTSI